MNRALYRALYRHLNMTLMKSLIKPDYTYLMTAFVSCPFISIKRQFELFQPLVFLTKAKTDIYMLQWRRITGLFLQIGKNGSGHYPYIIGCISKSR